MLSNNYHRNLKLSKSITLEHLRKTIRELIREYFIFRRVGKRFRGSLGD
jgi:hypothetical protein